MTTNLLHHNPRLDASGCWLTGGFAGIYHTHNAPFGNSQVKHVLNAAITGSGGNRDQQRPLRPISYVTRSGEAPAGGTLTGASPVTFIGDQTAAMPGCSVRNDTNTASRRGQLRRPFRAGGHGPAFATSRDGLIGRLPSGPGGLAVAS